MWKPDEVLPRHKRRAVAIWTMLVVGIIVYSVYILYQAVERRENPGTTFEISDIVYAYPDIWVCLYVDYGCDELELEKECMRSSNATDGGATLAVFYPGGEYEQILPGERILTPSRGWCVEYKTSNITAFLGQERDERNYLDYIFLEMSWYPGGFQNDSKTCVAEGWETHNEWMYTFLSDSGTGSVSTGIQVPYSCISNASTSHAFTYVGIGVTKEERLTGDVDVTFEALTTSTATRKMKLDPDIAKPYGHLYLQVQQERNSLLIYKEIDPFDLAELFGSVGGFWDLLLLLWPIFFVAASQQAPHLKGRSFKKVITKGIGGIRNGSPVEHLGPPKRAESQNGHRPRLSV